MPQIAKGKETRTEVITVRFTKEQRRELEAMYGKAARGVHAIVVAALRERKK